MADNIRLPPGAGEVVTRNVGSRGGCIWCCEGAQHVRCPVSAWTLFGAGLCILPECLLRALEEQLALRVELAGALFYLPAVVQEYVCEP